MCSLQRLCNQCPVVFFLRYLDEDVGPRINKERNVCLISSLASLSDAIYLLALDPFLWTVRPRGFWRGVCDVSRCANLCLCRRLRLPLKHSPRSEEHTSELQSPDHLVCRLLLEKKKITILSIRHGKALISHTKCLTTLRSSPRCFRPI